MKKNTLLTITGPTCSGKSTLENLLRTKYGTQKIVSFTTRKPRAGEKDRVDYYFIPKGTVEDYEIEGKIAEHVVFGDNDYGILGSELEEKLYAGPTVVVVEPNGVNQLAKYCRANNLKHRALFITNEPLVLAARFLRRFKDDDKALPLDYAPRLIHMIQDEQKWVTAYPYHCTYSEFNKQNENEVVEHVYNNLLK